MTHSLNLPELPPHINGKPFLQWEVRLDSRAQIEARLVWRGAGRDDETVCVLFSADPETVEWAARQAWENFKIVNGMVPQRPDPDPRYSGGV